MAPPVNLIIDKLFQEMMTRPKDEKDDLFIKKYGALKPADPAAAWRMIREGLAPVTSPAPVAAASLKPVEKPVTTQPKSPAPSPAAAAKLKPTAKQPVTMRPKVSAPAQGARTPTQSTKSPPEN